MRIDRRTMMAGSAALIAAGPSLAQRSAGLAWFDRAIVIDALGAVSDPYAPAEVLRWSDRGFGETMATGVTMVRDTVFPVGNVADPWGEYQKAIKGFQNFAAANPDRLIVVRTAADILKAKREKKFAALVGTQDSCMVGSELDRLAQLLLAAMQLATPPGGLERIDDLDASGIEGMEGGNLIFHDGLSAPVARVARSATTRGKASLRARPR